VYGEGKAQVVDPWRATGASADTGRANNFAHEGTQSRPGISAQTAVVMQEQGGVGAPGETRAQALLEVAIDFDDRIARERNKARLVELRLTDKQDVFGRVIVADCKARELSAT
jgi:hypothetical protein